MTIRISLPGQTPSLDATVAAAAAAVAVDDDDDDDSITIVEDWALAGNPPRAAESPPRGNDRFDPQDHDESVESPSGSGTTTREPFSPCPTQVVASSMTTPELEKESPEPLDIVSPATQTLNTLSQNMGDLRATEAEESNANPPRSDGAVVPAAERTPPVVATTLPKSMSLVQWITHRQDTMYDWLSMEIHSPPHQSLGMIIQVGTFDDAMVSSQSEERKPCRIVEIVPGGTAEQQGLQVGDWIGHRKSAETPYPILASIQDVRDFAKRTPCCFSVLRIKKKPSSCSNVVLVAEAKKKDRGKMNHGQVPPEISSHAVGLSLPPEPDTGSQEEIYHFCRLCNHLKEHSHPTVGRSKPRAHHAWCPQNPFFRHNGSQPLLDRIQHGRHQLQCPACETEYRTGKLEQTKNHSQLCLKNQKRIKDEFRQHKDKEEHRDRAKEKKHSDQVQKEHTKKRRQDFMLSSAEEDENELVSHRPISKKKKRTDSCGSNKKGAPTSAMSCRAESIDITSEASKPTRPKTSSASTPKAFPANSKRLEGRRLMAAKASETEPGSCPVPSEANASISRSQHGLKKVGTFKPLWRSTSENPWGPSAFQDGDVLLYGPQRGANRLETAPPCGRYSLCPFADGSSYKTTHHHPEFIVLSLLRDPSAQIPWGLEVSRDEFGHACLVTGVQPMSPAAEAVLVGSPHVHRLKIHDMVLMVNGRVVGGMTEAGLELELELSGRSLHLVVAQYKHSQGAARQLATLEMQVTSLMDQDLRDDRVVGWREIGCGSLETMPIAQSPQHAATDRTAIDPEPSRSAIAASFDVDCVEERPDYVRCTPSSSVPSKHHNHSSDQKTIESQESVLDASRYVPFGYSDEGRHNDEESSSGVEGTQMGIAVSAPSSYSDRIQQFILERQDCSDDRLNSYSSGSEDGLSIADDGSRQWDGDNNAWNGCVCGMIHKESRLFWIQCDVCNSWYDVAERCVGFSEKQAQQLERWICWACGDGEGSQPMGDRNPIVPASSSCDRDRTLGGPQSKEAPGDKSISHIESNPRSRLMDIDKTKSAVWYMQPLSSVETAPGSDDDNQSCTKETTSKRPPTASFCQPARLQPTHEGDLISNSVPHKLDDGTFKKPPGMAPVGFACDTFPCVGTPIVEELQINSREKAPAFSPAEPQELFDGSNNGLVEPRNIHDFGVIPDVAHVMHVDTTLKNALGQDVPRRSRGDGDLRDKTPVKKASPGHSSQTHPLASTTAFTSSRRTKGINNQNFVDHASATISRSTLQVDSPTILAPMRRKPHAELEEIKGDGDVNVAFNVGDMVDVIPHAWPLVNNVGGIGKVIKVSYDVDGKRVYDVKYPISRHTEKNIYAEWVKVCYLG